MAGIGRIEWVDLTVAEGQTTQIRDFYQAVVGWDAEGVDCGGYDDFCMNTPDEGSTVAGICHKKGVNARLPGFWLPYLPAFLLGPDIRLVNLLAMLIFYLVLFDIFWREKEHFSSFNKAAALFLQHGDGLLQGYLLLLS